MLHTFELDDLALQSDPNLDGMEFLPGSHANAYASETGQEIYRFLTSRFGVAVLIGAIVSAPSRPHVIATEPWVHRLVGDAGFRDEEIHWASRAGYRRAHWRALGAQGHESYGRVPLQFRLYLHVPRDP